MSVCRQFMRAHGRIGVSGCFRGALIVFLMADPLVPARATVLTFDPVQMNFERISQLYGDRVTSTLVNGYEYGDTWGFTPNVTIEYGPIPPSIPTLWTTGFGDLTSVLFEDQDGNGVLDITLVADPQWNVVVHGFDMASYSAVPPINSVTVRDGDGTVLFSEVNVYIAPAGHRSFVFDPPLRGQSVVVAFNSANLQTKSDDVGIDNIAFGQIAVATPVAVHTWGSVKARYGEGDQP